MAFGWRSPRMRVEFSILRAEGAFPVWGVLFFPERGGCVVRHPPGMIRNGGHEALGNVGDGVVCRGADARFLVSSRFLAGENRTPDARDARYLQHDFGSTRRIRRRCIARVTARPDPVLGTAMLDPLWRGRRYANDASYRK
jgi:hypothetical protein